MIQYPGWRTGEETKTDEAKTKIEKMRCEGKRTLMSTAAQDYAVAEFSS